MAFLVFAGLQVLDTLTTLWFLRLGIAEANPLVAAAFTVCREPALALALVKLSGVGLALLAWQKGRGRLLRWVNVLFAGCVAWNLLTIGLGPLGPA